MMKSHPAMSLFLATAILAVTVTAQTPDFTLSIFHDNDVHSRFTEFNRRGVQCTYADVTAGHCFGGMPRRFEAIKRLRAQFPNSLVVSAGDQFQGTLWYTLFKWKPIAVAMNEIKYDAFSFGNHEFDDGLPGLAPFMKNITTPVVATNIDGTGTELEGLFKSSVVKTVGGQKIGIVGYLTPQTAVLANTGGLKFEDEVAAITREVATLTAQGINKIVAVGHSGINIDRALCQKVKGLDVVVGGHTNTFLYTGDAPSDEEPEGVYPEVFKDTGSPCLVVQDSAFGKYMGALSVTFDPQGVAKTWTGNPILLNTSWPENKCIEEKLADFDAKLHEYRTKVVGTTAVALDGSRKGCRLAECNLGNILTDAIVFNFVNRTMERANKVGHWTEVSLAMINGGSVRDFEAEPGHVMTMEHVLGIWPFGNTIDIVRLTGRTLMEIFEYSVAGYDPGMAAGKYLQISGFKVEFNLSKPDGQKVTKLLAVCANCSMPKYEPVDPAKEYNVATLLYLIKGGDGFSMIPRDMLRREGSEDMDFEIMENYMTKFSPLRTGLEQRSVFNPENPILEHNAKRWLQKR